MIQSWVELEPYTGLKAAGMLQDEAQRTAYVCNWEQLKRNYGDNVDFQLLHKQVMLRRETVDFLYQQFTPTQTCFQVGTRPYLEQIVSEITDGCGSDGQKAFALMRFTRSLYQKNAGLQLFYGGTEEELIKKGEQLCECLGRLYVALCEIAGIPGRILMHVIGGHIVAEVYIEGKWAYMDPRIGFHCRWPDGSLTTAWEIWHHPELFDMQDDTVKDELSARWTWEDRVRSNRARLFHPREIIVVTNYSLSDARSYNYNWLTSIDLARNGFTAANRKYRTAAAKVFGLTDLVDKPSFILSIKEGQVVHGSISIIATPKNFTVPPVEVDFYIDGQLVYSNPGMIPIGELHNYVEGGVRTYTCFGAGEMWDTTTVENGSHTITVCTQEADIGLISVDVHVDVHNS
ncbi:transglutaminase domain-containing protein [Paenibacillus oceani]|uniref:Transglutaminase-like domain-containing protein n=1 Tax=Paenibacillus oceani TaxID=2772510 RepID=A0A927CFI8_9BACL|nr:transglutaminase domain-containing protein [Paenibacillus oceani]MBD2865718.1 hypothetical protein [Paenibacillus oceani]